MSLTVAEANATNRLLAAMIGATSAETDPPPTDEEVRAAAELLAESAYRRLSAGYNAASVRNRWVPLRTADPDAHPRTLRHERPD